MRNQVARNLLDIARADLLIQPFGVEGFGYICDRGGNEFDPYTNDHAETAGFPFREGMPVVEGFFYLSDEYAAYLATLIEQKLEHPANTNKLPWVHIGAPDAPQHHSTLSLEAIPVEFVPKEIT